MTSPNIYEFTEFRAWLAQWHAERQKADPSFTKTVVSHRLGLPKTRGYFSDVLAGKRVTDTFVERFCELVDLPHAQERYFRCLVRFDQAETPEEKELALEQLVALNKTPAIQLSSGSWRYYRDWRHGAIRALLETEDLDEETLGKAASTFKPPITPAKARESLDLLLELGLVERNSSGCFKPTSGILASPDWAKEEVFRLLQAQQFELVRTALAAPSQGGRSVVSNLVSVSESGLSLIQRSLDKFRNEIRAIIRRDTDPADRVLLVANAVITLRESRP